MLRFYKANDNAPTVQLMPTKKHITAAQSRVLFTMFAENTLTAISVREADISVQFIEVVCRGKRLYYEDIYPRFHLSIDTMRGFIAPPIVPCIVANLIYITRFKELESSPTLFTAPMKDFYFSVPETKDARTRYCRSNDQSFLSKSDAVLRRRITSSASFLS